jgi:hypothetical protein
MVLCVRRDVVVEAHRAKYAALKHAQNDGVANKLATVELEAYEDVRPEQSRQWANVFS